MCCCRFVYSVVGSSQVHLDCLHLAIHQAGLTLPLDAIHLFLNVIVAGALGLGLIVPLAV